MANEGRGFDLDDVRERREVPDGSIFDRFWAELGSEPPPHFGGVRLTAPDENRPHRPILKPCRVDARLRYSRAPDSMLKSGK